ncbi:phosphopantetheine-binding protein [Alkalihalobacillus sp. 1P02AB]|uniref:phosphopantetheine-binding protein n=1 Tax=Alkalihalobacillus sp. 1P02AB TaxID=3132260 RepID=UPI0039A65A49
MNREAITQLIHEFLVEQLKLADPSILHNGMRLNEDLCVDSLMLLQLILFLEVEAGFSIPDEMVIPKNFQTIGSLVEFLDSLPQNQVSKEY